MKTLKLSLLVLLYGVLQANTYADCTFEMVNNSDHPVTVQGFYLDNGDDLDSKNWLTVPPASTLTQVRNGTVSCNANYKHSGQLVTKVALQNSSGYWIGNKGFMFASDRSYANIGTDQAMSDDESSITLSNGIPITATKFKIVICNDSVDSDDCN